MTGLRVPVATYRLQFTTDFGFDEACKLIPYLEALGITDLYASPLFHAQDGSEHGYDVTDPRRLDPGVGGRSGFEELSANLKAREMGLLLDIVPNHMAASPENPWWRDVLRLGPHSLHAAKFDINWEGEQKPGVPSGKLTTPILGAPLAEVLEKGELKLVLGTDGFQINYYEYHLPVCPSSYQYIMEEAFQAEAQAPSDQAIARLLLTLTAGINVNTIKSAAKSGTLEVGKKIWELYQYDAEVRELINRALEFWNNAGSRKRFAKLLKRQHYRPIYWRDARQQLNYRRFFDINNLVCLRVEDEPVFRAVHTRVLELVRTCAVTGLRIDHVDGLHDPEGYLIRLQEYLAAYQLENDTFPARVSSASTKSNTPGFYVVVEKILESGEELPKTWPVAGTTGYDFLNMLNGIFVDDQGLNAFDTLYQELDPASTEFKDLVNTQKRKIMHDLFNSEITALSGELIRLAKHDPHGQPIPSNELEAALLGVTAAFPVYRTYIRGFSVTPRDRKYIDEALSFAARYGDGSEAARSFISCLLRLEFHNNMTGEAQKSWLDFVMRWQQFTGPIMAKGFEDTVLYLYNRLISLNEVGGNPSAGGLTVAGFHERMRDRYESSPHTLNTTSTHDTKRSEDVRARINVLSEIPEIWLKKVRQWQEFNAMKKSWLKGRPVPDANFELLLYQTLIGAWPIREAEEAAFMDRLEEYLVKASREAKTCTSWLEPNEKYERALCTFALNILEDKAANRFREDMKRLVKTVAYYGALNSLAQVLLKVVCPGVPDFFMGEELWDFRLVDPDNRRPVDFDRRASLLAKLQKRERDPDLASDLLKTWDEDLLKLYVTWKALGLRRDHATVFTSGSYLPLEVAGPAQEHVCALARHTSNKWVVAVVPRLPVRLVAGPNPEVISETKLPVGKIVWGDTMLLLPAAAPIRWQNTFTKETIIGSKETKGAFVSGCATCASGGIILPLERVLGTFPLALLNPRV